MGAWGKGSFENDMALDWLFEFRSNPSERTLLDVFEGIYPRPHRGILDRILRREVPRSTYQTGECVVAAAEVVATLLGRPPSPIDSSLTGLPEVVIGEEVRRKAVEAIHEIMANSDLKDRLEVESLEDDLPDYEDWLVVMRDLLDRLGLAARGGGG